MPIEPQLRQLITLARDAYQRREYERAEPLLCEIIAQHPGSAETFNMLGVIYHHHGRLDEARQMFEQALHLNPSYTEAALNLAVVLSDTSHYGEAEAVYRKTLRRAEAEPRQLDQFARGKLANLHAATAEAYREAGMYEEAEAEYRKALGLCPGFMDLHCELAMMLSERGDREGAVRVCREALLHNPRYVQAHIQLGAELYALGRREEARAAWEQALAIEPGNRRVRVYLNLVTPERQS
ncbi:MAG: tetratricopeptide repeat protein [Myxococcales bacterium]|nr:tetratricopeptide repeat protein [Myxococcota bacterium]MDW8281598.1 tetratricopeptide repeat protein [Myxococcales bacterium]